MGLFLTIVLSLWAGMHAYVFWRLGSIPWIAAHSSWPWRLAAGVLCWSAYPLARMLRSRLPESAGWTFEWLTSNWVGVLFLLFSVLLITDVLTLGGWLWRAQAGYLRGWGLLVALVLSGVAMVQALRPPVVRDYEVMLPGLPPERDGLVIAHVSDLHLGSLTTQRWFADIVSRVNEMRPDLVVLVGDVVDGDVKRAEDFAAQLRQFSAPLGVWAVTGNHEFYAGVEASVRLLHGCGIPVLRDTYRELVPGLKLAGVDDFTARLQFGGEREGLQHALAASKEGATILLSHSPLRGDQAASLGAGLMLSGHTHDGQIWPFNYLVQSRYPLMAGRYAERGMTVIVSRGTGMWGPRMRLWRPSEIVRIRLRASPRGR